MATDNVTTEFYIDGAWVSSYSGTNLDERVRKTPGVSISRGMGDLQGSPTPASSEFDVNNRDGVFSNRNTSSVLYGKFPRYTKVRHSIPTAGGTLDSYVRFFQANNTGTLSTTDKAVLEITGDLDVRLEMTPDTWAPVEGFALAGRYRISGNNRVWLLWLDYLNRINFRWSNDGTTLLDMQFDPWPAARGYGRQALRFTMDVNNGAGGRTGTLYYADSISGSWTQIQQVTQAGTTSFYGSSTAPLEIGNVDSGSPLVNTTQFYGKVHALELRNGIGGTLVANMSAAARAVGDTSWSDGLGTPNTWTITGTARVGTDRIRHTGEIDAIDHRWDETRRDVWMPMKSLGPLNRLLETDAPEQSPIYRNLIQYAQPAGYWPMEDGSGSTRASGAAGTTNSTLSGCSFTGSRPTGLNGSAGSIKLDSATSIFTLEAAGRTSTGENTVLWYFKLPSSSLPAANRVLVFTHSTGTVRRWEVSIGPTGYQFVGYSATGSTVVSDSLLFGTGGSPAGQWVGMQLTLSQEGANVRYTWRWWGVVDGTFWVSAVGGATYAGSIGRMLYFNATAANDASFVGAEFAHVIMTMDVFSATGTTFRDSSNGYNGEAAGTRAARIAGEAGITLEMYGDPAATQLMGVQDVAAPIELLKECVAVDNAMLFDLRDRFALGFRTRVDIENRLWDWTLPYASSYLAAVPAFTEDGDQTKNDFTVSRPGGGSGRSVLTTGALSTQEPPNGIGRRPGSASMNAYTDDQTTRLAEYQVWLRTRDELRTPSLEFELHRRQLEASTVMTERVIAANMGDWVKLTGLPTFLDGNDRNLLVLGYRERMNGQQWTVDFNVTTADGYRAPLLNVAVLADNGVTTLNAGITSTATSMVIKTPTTSQPWVDSVSFASDLTGGLAVLVAGELMTITALTAPSVVGSDYQQTATVTRSVNGVVKAQSAGAVVETRDAHYLGL